MSNLFIEKDGFKISSLENAKNNQIKKLDQNIRVVVDNKYKF